MRTPGRLFSATFVLAVVGAAAAAAPADAQAPEDTPAPVAGEPAAPAAGQAVPASAGQAAPADAFSLDGYRAALAERRLDAAGPFGTEQLAELIERAERHLAIGRRDEA